MKRVVRCPLFRSKWRQHSILLFTSVILILSTLAACGPRIADLEAVEYTPLRGGDWEVSTPAEQGLDPMLGAELYLDAAKLETLYGLLVIKNGHLRSPEKVDTKISKMVYNTTLGGTDDVKEKKSVHA